MLKSLRCLHKPNLLFNCPYSSRGDTQALLRQLSAKIRFSGPITVAEYMREVLTSPHQGFYMKKGVLGAEGHFVTSPEVSQMFGECLAIWLLTEWQKMGRPSPLQLVELGPGKGTLLADILRTWQKLRPTDLANITIHLVEISPEMRGLQEAVLCGHAHNHQKPASKLYSKFGPAVHWHSSLREVPRKFSLFLLHEFLDALPVHKFQKTAEGWREVLIDIQPDSEEPLLRYVISREATPSCILLDKFDTRQAVELSPQAGLVVRQLSERVVEEGGLALIADYGHLGEEGDTFRAFRHHQQVNPLESPGSADLTVDVDFKYISEQVIKDCAVFGPVDQGDFLHALGIATRCQQLVRQAAEQDREEIEQAYMTLTHPQKMGARFKFCALFPGTMQQIHSKFPPVGFHSPLSP